ncbi:C2H2-like zinc finger protein [Actinidia rufa]|uniref:C2H2-like zinc finger protein n=1 Tax=Actinidia rufa TaxID=165716 RepID=A0A7J0DPQ5_9ERIC|nr:C2H2-like zinc finger protein [Actinidia rufa]
MLYKFLFVSLFLQARIGVTLANQDTEGHATKRTLKQEEQHAHEVHCSRERSRAAWKIIEEYLMPFVEQEKYEISRKCRLHPDFDIFRDQEQHKIHVDVNEWRCGYCKKVFRAEKFLDQHFDNRHNDLLNVNQSKCLADVCGALHCDLVMDTNLKFRKTKCNTAAAARNHHLCESLADSCFPMNQSPSANRLHGTLLNFKKTMLCLQFFWRTKTLFQREAEAYKHSLLGSFNIDLDVPPYLLSYRLFVPERKEKRNPSVEAHLTTWTKTKALLVGKS